MKYRLNCGKRSLALLVFCMLGAFAARAQTVGTQQAGRLRVTGTLIKTFPDRSEAVMKVSAVTPFGGLPVTLNPPRVTLLIFRDGVLPDTLVDGTPFTAEGKDIGRGRPLRVESVSTDGSDMPVSESRDATDAASASTADEDGVVTSSALSPVKSGDPASSAPVPGATKPATAAKTCRTGNPIRRITHEPVPKAFVTLRDGTLVEGSRLLTLEATGYGPEDNGEWGDQTFLGTTVGFGTVAVDPRVIPLGKHLWVEGYGFCIALDIGGAIKGHRIDLGQDNEDDAQAVGRQKRRVLVLD